MTRMPAGRAGAVDDHRDPDVLPQRGRQGLAAEGDQYSRFAPTRWRADWFSENCAKNSKREYRHSRMVSSACAEPIERTVTEVRSVLAAQNALKVMIVRVSWMPGMVWTF